MQNKPLTQKLIQSNTNNNLIENLAKKFKLNNNIDLNRSL